LALGGWTNNIASTINLRANVFEICRIFMENQLLFSIFNVLMKKLFSTKFSKLFLINQNFNILINLRASAFAICRKETTKI